MIHMFGNLEMTWLLIQVDIGGYPPYPIGPKHIFDHFGNLLFLSVFNFWGHFEALDDVF
jgi:hypothetical protein